MAKSVSTSQRGFTLIEMSIVLVIIGLIIGGILKGQELIESSRQKNLMSQIDRLKSSTTSFVDRYRGIPGDFDRTNLLPRGAGIATGGNNDGVVGATGAATVDLITPTQAILNSSENAQYFNQLLASEMAGNGSVVGAAVAISCFSGLCATPSPLPGSAFPSSGLTINYGTHTGGSNGAGGTAVPKQAHWFVLSRYDTGALTAADAVLSASRAYQIDSKYDDGGAGSGNIRSGMVGTGCGTDALDYTASATANECILLFTLE